MSSRSTGRGHVDAFSRDLADTSTPAGRLAARLEALGSAAAVSPSDEFRTALRTRLLAVAAVQGVGAASATPSPSPLSSASSEGWRAAVATAAAGVRPWVTPGRTAPRGMGLAAGAMASVVALTGISVASTRSLPGDAFYEVKRQAEAIELRVADGPVEKGSTHLEHAATRLREVRALTLGRDELALRAGSTAAPVAAGAALGGSRSERVARALRDMDEATRAGERLLTSAYREERDLAPLRVLATFASRQTRALADVIPSLPASTRAQAQASLALVEAVETETDELLAQGGCTTACDPSEAAPTTPPSPPSGSPAPGVEPRPSATADEPPCGCAPAPEPQPTPQPTSEPTASPEPTPTTEPGPSPSPSPSGSPSPSPSGLPVPVPVPVPVPTALPTVIPTLIPAPIASLLPTALPIAPGAGSATTRVVVAAPGAAAAAL